jgi:ribonucleoside-diphosphate reductase beta chain
MTFANLAQYKEETSTMANLVPFVHRAVNWNTLKNETVLEMWEINTSQFWLEKEIDLSADVLVWKTLAKQEKTLYQRVLGGLTLLDTKQGNRGMPLISLHFDDEQIAAVLSFMGTMEHIHAKSYSSIFSTLCSTVVIDEIFNWVQHQENLQYKAERVSRFYEDIFTPNITKVDLYKALTASVLLESFLFYSGFFFPLYLAGQGKMVASGEIINLIIRDESVHGQFVGLLAQDIFEEFDEETQKEMTQFTNELLEDLYANELEYAKELYSEVSEMYGADEKGKTLLDEVEAFLRYNANKAFDNLGFDHAFEDEEINSVVENGLDTAAKNHDFFSVKGNTYTKAQNVTRVTPESFEPARLALEKDLFDEIEALEEAS